MVSVNVSGAAFGRSMKSGCGTYSYAHSSSTPEPGACGGSAGPVAVLVGTESPAIADGPAAGAGLPSGAFAGALVALQPHPQA